MKLSFNSPVILWFSIICLVSVILGIVSNGAATTAIFSGCLSSLAGMMAYVRFFEHIFEHANWQHFICNMTMFLVAGPLLEEKYGSLNILLVILATALVTGIMNFVFFPHIQLLGASGVVFVFILLSSFTSVREGTITATFILVAIIYIGGQVFDGIFVQDNVSNLAHVLGDGVGSAPGYVVVKDKMV